MLPDLDWRVIVSLAWGGGVVWLYGSVLRIRLVADRAHRDRRTRRDLSSGIALFLTALGSCAAIILALAGADGVGMRGFATALALGAFLGAGWIMRSEAKTEATDDPDIDA